MPVPWRVDVRLDRVIREGISRVMDETGATLSQAVRALLTLGLERSGQLDRAWKDVAFREGLAAGSAKFKAQLAAAQKEEPPA